MGFVSLCKALDLTTPSDRALAAEASLFFSDNACVRVCRLEMPYP